MKGYILNRHGKSSVLKMRDMDIPDPKAGEILVRISSIGLNYAEIQSRKGLYGWAPKLPYTPGMEGSGLVEKTGPGVYSFKPGDPVIVTAQFGAYSEYICVKEKLVIPAIDGYSMEENAAVAVNFATAWVALFEMGRVRKGETVLVHAAAGGVGTAAVQLAKAYGCRVFGTVSRDDKINFLKQFNLNGVINYARDDFEIELKKHNNGTGADLVLEVVGGDVFRKSMKILNPFGRTVVMGFASLNLKKWNPVSWYQTWRSIPRVKISNLAVHSSGVLSSHLGYLLNDEVRMRLLLKKMTDYMKEHNLRPEVGKIFPFEELPAAHDWMESRKSVGKIVVNTGHNLVGKS